jgi:hypothetical protein
MNPLSMTSAQQSTSLWQVPAGAALRLPAVPRVRWLRVVAGEVWLTLDGSESEPPEDAWLVSGSLSLLPAGCEAVLEGHPAAQFQLLEPAADPLNSAPVCARASVWPSLRDWIRRLSLEPDAPSFAA